MRDSSRREFMAAAALVAATNAGNRAEAEKVSSRSAQSQAEPETVPASEKIVLGFIGVGGMGTGLVNTFKKFPGGVDRQRLCDVYEPHLNHAWDAGRRLARGFFRLSLGACWTATISMPSSSPHLTTIGNGITAIMACQAGKDGVLRKSAGRTASRKAEPWCRRLKSTSASARWAT